MGQALIGGYLAEGRAEAGEIRVVELDVARSEELKTTFPGISVSDAVDGDMDTLVAVKPQHVGDVVSKISGRGVRVLSVAAGVRISEMESAAPDAHVVRAMPNTPALIGKGASAIAGGTHATADDLEWAESILGAVGMVVRVDEHDLDAVTGLSGSGPAYVFHLAEGLVAAGIARGLSPEVADALTRQTLLGAASLLSSSGEDPAILRQRVTSPGGTTAAGLSVFAEADLLGLVDRVVAAATERSIELGEEN